MGYANRSLEDVVAAVQGGTLPSPILSPNPSDSSSRKSSEEMVDAMQIPTNPSPQSQSPLTLTPLSASPLESPRVVVSKSNEPDRKSEWGSEKSPWILEVREQLRSCGSEFSAYSDESVRSDDFPWVHEGVQHDYRDDSKTIAQRERSPDMRHPDNELVQRAGNLVRAEDEWFDD